MPIRNYVGIIEHSGGLGNGYGGTYDVEFAYTSSHKANSKTNETDAIKQWYQKHGRNFSSVKLIETRLED